MKQGINIHTHFKTSASGEVFIRNGGLLRADAYTNLPYLVSVGLHPWHINKMTLKECTDRLIDLATLNNVFAIGEIGIDRAIDTPIGVQLKYFEAQLVIARAVAKPVILHAVRSYSDFLPYLRKAKIPFVFHGFNGNGQQARELIKHGAYLSFGKGLWETKSQEVFKEIPLSQLFFETDNHSTLTIKMVYEQAAMLKNMEVDELKYLINDNFVAIKNSKF